MYLRDEPLCHSKMLAALVVLFDDMKVDLYKNNATVTRENVVGDFTICNYNSYAGGVVTWAAPSQADDGTWEVVGTVAEFRPGSNATPNEAYGIYCRDDDDSALLFAAPFDGGPKHMHDATNAIVVTLRLRIKGQSLVVVVS